MGTQLTEALNSLMDQDHHLIRMPGSGLIRQVKVHWHGRRLAVIIWDTGRVHVQGMAAGHFAQLLSVAHANSSRHESKPSRTPALLESPSTSGPDPPGHVGSPISSNCKPRFGFSTRLPRPCDCVVSVLHAVMFFFLGVFLRAWWFVPWAVLRGDVAFFPGTFLTPRRWSRHRRKRIRGSCSPAAPRRGAKCRRMALTFKAPSDSILARGTRWLMFFLLPSMATCILILVLWQTGFTGIRVGEASTPGPTVSASDGVTTPLLPSQDQDLMDTSGSGPVSVPGSSPPLRLLSQPSTPMFPGVARLRPGLPARLVFAPSPSQVLRPSPLLLPSHGWATFSSMRLHIDAHLAGQLTGDIPMDWLRGQDFSTCVSDTSRPLAEGAPGVGGFYQRQAGSTSVPKGARDAWSRCLTTALADVVAHRDLKSWTDLLTLPALVLPAPSRGGRKHVLRHEGSVAFVLTSGPLRPYRQTQASWPASRG